jgi:transposase InsO family protein
VPKFAQIAKPLTELLRKDKSFAWTERQQSAFENLKTVLCSEQVLAYPDFSSEFILTTDASKVAVAAILSQVQDAVERPISFASRQLHSAEQNYSVSELEMLAVTWGTRHYRCYLYGKRFVLRTDHAALRYLHTFADNNSRLLRWSLKPSEFDFTEHRPGTQIRHADALSRVVQSIAIDKDLSRDEVKQQQAKDKFCQSLEVGRVKGKSEYFADEEGLIYRRRKNGEHQLIVPSSLATKVIALNHDPVTVAHPGRSRTLDILCLRFYWTKMRRDVEEYVKNCHECRRLKHRHEFKAPLGDVSEPTALFHVTAMDIAGPFPITAAKNKYLLTFMDHLTHFVEAVPIQEMTAQQCARAYATHIIARHGAGSKLITDQGRNFTSAFFRETCKILGIKQLLTTAYHPQANDKLERWHKSLAEGLSHYVNACGNDWETGTILFDGLSKSAAWN